jgi:flagellar P-ring protein precursor FlgI
MAVLITTACGLVVGLPGTGDQTSQAPFTIQSIKNMLIRYGITIPANTNPQLKNVAAVTVHADLPPFAKTGQTIDVTVSSIGNAQSLRGGSLLMTPLIGADGEVYGIAQGSMIVSVLACGQDSSRFIINVRSGRVPMAQPWARSSQQFCAALCGPEPQHAGLHHGVAPTTGINTLLGAERRRPWTLFQCASVHRWINQRIGYLSTLEAVEIEPGEAPAR